jgi:hypothetical protein
METPNLAKAIIAVMQEVKGIEKNLTVGGGQNSYKGVADQEVKKVIGEAMARHGLSVLPIGVEPKTTIERWEEGGRTRQLVFTEAVTKYLLMHTSGETREIAGYGHGTDSQDKAAGKATTYALKYALLYTFLVPTGKIDDADVEHSDSKPVPQKAQPITVEQASKELKEVETVEQLRLLWNKIPTGAREKIKNDFSLKREELEGGLA